MTDRPSTASTPSPDPQGPDNPWAIPPHGITDPMAPLGYQCGDAACEWHGVERNRADSPSPEGAEPLGPKADAEAIAAIIVQFGYPTLGVTPTVQAAMKLASLIVLRRREAALPEPSLDVPDMSVLTAVLDDVPGRIRDTLNFDGEAMAAWIIGQWPEYVRLARLRGTEGSHR